MIHQPESKTAKPAKPTRPAYGDGSSLQARLRNAQDQMTFDPKAVQAAVGSLYETLRKCEDERVRLVNLMDDARAVGIQEQTDHPLQKSTTTESLTAQQLSKVPSLDAWISRRLSELQAADRVLAKRQEKLETLEGSLSRIAQGLSIQLQQISTAKDELAGEQGSFEVRMMATRQRLDQQVLQMQQQVDDHIARMNEAQAEVDSGLARFDSTGKETIHTLERKFETMAQGIVGRLEGVRKPVEKWLQQHLVQYEAMLNDCVMKNHPPVAKRIEEYQEELANAMQPMEEHLNQQMKLLADQVKENSQHIEASMHQQTDAIHEAMAKRVQQLDQDLAQLMEPMHEVVSEREQAVREQVAGFKHVFESSMATQRLAFEKTIQEQVYAAQTQIRVAVQTSNKQMSSQIEQLKAQFDAQLDLWSVSLEAQVNTSLENATSQLEAGYLQLGSKSNAFEQWISDKRKIMAAQMNDLEAEARISAENAEQIMVHRVRETKKHLPVTIENLIQEAQEGVQQRVEMFHQQIQKAYQLALTETQDRAGYLESQMLAMFAASDQRMRERMATLHGDARSMLDMVENQLTRRVEASQFKVVNTRVNAQPATDGSISKND